MQNLNIDLETYSSVNLKKAGAWKYIDSPDFQILLFSYSLNGAAPINVDFASGEVLPPEIAELLTSPDCIKHAWNAAFEWGCLSKYIGRPLPPEQWRCTMVHSLYAGYPASLDAAGRALGLPEDKQKLNTGKALIRYFCVPCKPTKTNGYRTRNYPHHNPDRWRLFREYNDGDVITEMEAGKRLANVIVPDFVQKEWETDLLINFRGVSVDMDLVHGALEIGASVKNKLMNEAMNISGLNNPNSIKQLSSWLENETETEITSLNKETVSQLLTREDNSPEVQRMLEIRQELGKTSTKKYDAIENAICSDGRVRGLLQFYGANRTGRWAGRLVQVQNLPRTYTEPLELAREFVKDKKTDCLKVIYGSVPDTLSQLIRTAFVAAPGKVLIDADFSAIEARVISWLAKEEWRLEVFRTHGKIYEASASQMFGVPIELIKKGNPEYELRQRGKVAELALGYQGGVPAMRQMDSGHQLDDLSDDEVKDIVTRWRGTNKRIRDLWYKVDNAAVQVVKDGGSVGVEGLVIAREYDYAQNRDYMTILLPSGRKLYYISPQIGVNKWDNPSISYMGVQQSNKQKGGGKWQRIETYGGKLVENIVQAIARDCLALSIERLKDAGYEVIFHIHDEVVIECNADSASLEDVTRIMSQPVPWAADLPLNAEGWIGNFFKKD
ncbi:MAG: DNA polymerase [Clostridia bacterium]|nr:DNA polymerase [Clostridia bacterium]MBQ8637431.1 DNA polymerase [Clostridia bacterium]